MELSFPLFAGIIAAMLHVIAGPDHLAAVTHFAIESKKRAWKVGLFWGFGHLFGMLAIGLLFLIFKEVLPVESISEHSERLVGWVLIGLAIWIFVRIFYKEKKHRHMHVHVENNPVIHKHDHFHDSDKIHDHAHPKLRQGVLASFSVGFLHGLAGIAHFLLFLPVIGFDTRWAASKYIIGFAIGTVIAMVAFAVVIGKIASFSKRDHNDTFFKGLRLAGALFALVIGIYWLVR